MNHRERGGALQIVLLALGALLLLALVTALAGYWFLSRYLGLKVDTSGDTVTISIDTPEGGFEVEASKDPGRDLRLPVYPGATATKDGGSVKLRGRAGREEGGLDVAAAEYFTPDPIDKVDAWYRQQLGSAFQRQQGWIRYDESGEEIGEKIGERISERIGEAIEREIERHTPGEADVKIDVEPFDWRVRVEPGGDDVLFTREEEHSLRGVVLEKTWGGVRLKLFSLAEPYRQ